MATCIIATVLGILVVAIILNMAKKSAKKGFCECNCSACHGSCTTHNEYSKK